MVETAEMAQTTEIGNSGNGGSSGNSGNGLLQIWPPLQAQRRLSRIVKLAGSEPARDD